jgi:hypothetical protein
MKAITLLLVIFLLVGCGDKKTDGDAVHLKECPGCTLKENPNIEPVPSTVFEYD